MSAKTSTVGNSRPRFSASQLYVAIVSLVCVVALCYIYLFPPASLRVTREGVPHFTPRVAHPETGEPLDAGELVRHFRGD